MIKTFGLTNGQASQVLAGPKRPAMALQILLFAFGKKAGVTADECMFGLGHPHQSSSARFHELVKSGCFVRTKRKRATRAGGTAVVCVIEPTATFATYLNFIHRKDSRGPVKERALDEAMTFVRGWSRAKTKKKKRSLVSVLVHHLAALSEEWAQ